MSSKKHLPELIQDWLDNPPDGLIIYKYQGLEALEEAIEPMASALYEHKTQEQLMFVTDFPKEYIEDGGDVVRRRVYKSTLKTYFWEHKLLILQFRNCNQYCYVENAIKMALYDMKFVREREQEEVQEKDAQDNLKSDFEVYGLWPDGYLGLHSAREPDSCIELSYDTLKKRGLLEHGLRSWPTVAFETRTLSPLSVKYVEEFGLDWWFYQSQGLTKIVIVYYIDHRAQIITFEKWVCNITPPRTTRTGENSSKISPLTGKPELPASSFKKRCEQRIVYTKENGFGDNHVVLEIEKMLCLPEKSESDNDFKITTKVLDRYLRMRGCDAWTPPPGVSFPV